MPLSVTVYASRVLASKTLPSKLLAAGLFDAYLGDKPISPGAKIEILGRMMNLCR
jgi:hypothetical protein